MRYETITLGTPGPAGPPGPPGGLTELEVVAYVATQVVTVSDATRMLSSADHNKILDCIHITGCAVTVPGGLTSGIAGAPFTCGLSKGEGAGNVTVIAETIVKAPSDFLTMNTQFGMMTLTEWPDGTFRLYGGNAA
jgi:hypothetical protein